MKCYALLLGRVLYLKKTVLVLQNMGKLSMTKEVFMKQQTETKVTNLEELQQAIAKVKAAQVKFASFTQEQVDHIFREVAIAANNARIELAKMAVEETGMGLVEDKVIKNHFAAEYIYNKYKEEKTCGLSSGEKVNCKRCSALCEPPIWGIISLPQPYKAPRKN